MKHLSKRKEKNIYSRLTFDSRVFAIILLAWFGYSCSNSTVDPQAVEDITIQEMLVVTGNQEETDYNLALLNLGVTMEAWLFSAGNRMSTLDDHKFIDHGEIVIVETFNKTKQGRLSQTQLQHSVEAIEASLVYKGISYRASMYVPNSKTADFNLPPIIAIGSDIEGHDDDVIPAWYYDNLGNKINTTISEDDAMKSIKPVYIMNGSMLRSNSEKDVTIVTETPSSGPRLNATNPQYWLDNYSITQRYESDNKSEYAYVLGYSRASGGFSYFNHEDIRKIHKRDLGVVYTSDKHVWQVDYLFFDIDRLYVATYEHDWWVANKKWIDWGGGVGAEIMRSKFANEWYQKGWMDAPKPGTPVTINSKGAMTIK